MHSEQVFHQFSSAVQLKVSLSRMSQSGVASTIHNKGERHLAARVISLHDIHAGSCRAFVAQSFFILP